VRGRKMKCKEILNKTANEYDRILGNNLIGIYVHGSLAFGCFNHNKSDIDFIVVVKNIATIEEKENLIKTLLDLSKEAPKKGYEMSVVLSRFCKNFVYPIPFELHYSNAYLNSCKDNLREYCISMNVLICEVLIEKFIKEFD
jgi:predicted nucleotidyltransferase